MIWTALLFGLMSSFHCAVMCGPILLATSTGTNQSILQSTRLIYHLGRISTYALLGALMGLIGEGLYLAGLQQGISIVSGLLILLFIFLPKTPSLLFKGTGMNKISSGFKSLFAKLLQRRGLTSQFLTGSINGILPCGMVYIAMAAAASFKTPVDSMAYMVLFGLGTLPMLLFISLSGTLITFNFRSKINKVIPYTSALLGVIFILRGMSLNIPYLSPVIGAQKTCCAKNCHIVKVVD
jgi:sulfite exporter TauE/SafE